MEPATTRHSALPFIMQFINPRQVCSPFLCALLFLLQGELETVTLCLRNSLVPPFSIYSTQRTLTTHTHRHTVRKVLWCCSESGHYSSHAGRTAVPATKHARRMERRIGGGWGSYISPATTTSDGQLERRRLVRNVMTSGPPPKVGTIKTHAVPVWPVWRIEMCVDGARGLRAGFVRLKRCRE